jgi:ribosome-binding factor A
MSEFGLMTITEVRVTADLRQAKVYVSVFGDADRKKRSMKLLEDRKVAIRSAVGRAIRLRFLPELLFFLDETLDRAMHIETLLNRIHADEQGGIKSDLETP